MNPVLVSAPAAAGNFMPEFPSGYTYGRVWWFNDTPYGHLVGWDTAPTPASGYYVPAFHHRLMTVRQPITQVYYAVPAAATLSGASATPLTYCRAEFYALDELGSLPDGLWPLNERLSNVGNTPGVTVLANQLGTTSEGLTTVFDAANTAEDFFPYSSPTALRGVGISHTNANGTRPAVPDLQVATDGSVLVANAGLSILNGHLLAVNGRSFLDNNSLVTDGAGNFTTVGALPTVGVGVAAERAKADGVVVNAIGLTTILTLTAPNPAGRYRYRCGGRFRVNNGTSGQSLTFKVAYTDFDSGAAASVFFAGNGGGNDVTFNGVNTITNGVYSCTDRTIDVAAGSTITISYNDPANTPADVVSAVIEQR